MPMATAHTAERRNAMRVGRPKRKKRARPAGRRNLSAVAESIGTPGGYVVARYKGAR